MSNINLLPWRQDIIRYKNRFFGVISGTIVILTLSLIFLFSKIIDLQVDAVQQQIAILETASKQNKDTIAVVNKLKLAKTALLSRNKVIQSLQKSKTFFTMLLNTIVTIIPEGITLTEINMVQPDITIKGISNSDSRIFKLIQNLENLPWIKSATFNDISDKEEGENAAYSHTAHIQLSNQILFVIQATVKQDIE